MASMLRRGASVASSVLRQTALNAKVPVRSFSSRPVLDGVKELSAAAHRDPKYVASGSFVFLSAVAAAATMAASDSVSAEKKAEVYPVKNEFKDVVLYQYEVCPFCNKVRSFLDYHKIPYRVVEVNPLFKGELKWSEYQKVPVLTVEGEQINDSTEIINQLSERLPQPKKGWFGGKKQPSAAEVEEEAKWRGWVDSRLVHVLTPNLYRTSGEAWQAFDYITETGNFNFVERQAARVSGAVMMYIISKMVLKKRHGIEDERAALYEAVDEWVAAVGPGRAFLGGAEPSNADLSVFGVLRAVQGMDTFRDVMDNTTVKPWYDRMEAAVGGSTRMYA